MPHVTPGVTELRMQLATETIVPSAVLNVYGAAVNITSPRANGGIVPMLIRARGVGLFVGNVTLRITPTWSDGTVGAAVTWGDFTAADAHFIADLLSEPSTVPALGAPPPSEASLNCADFTLTLAAFWRQGVALTQLALDCASDQNAETATIEVIYRGLYT